MGDIAWRVSKPVLDGGHGGGILFWCSGAVDLETLSIGFIDVGRFEGECMVV